VELMEFQVNASVTEVKVDLQFLPGDTYMMLVQCHSVGMTIPSQACLPLSKR
jgi:hypothetical protein